MMSTPRSKAPFQRGDHHPATLGRGAECDGRDRADTARLRSPVYRRARPHGLATGLEYDWSTLMEAGIARWNCVTGDGPHSQTNGCQATEVNIAASVLNRMLDLGRPACLRTT